MNLFERYFKNDRLTLKINANPTSWDYSRPFFFFEIDFKNGRLTLKINVNPTSWDYSRPF